MPSIYTLITSFYRSVQIYRISVVIHRIRYRNMAKDVRYVFRLLNVNRTNWRQLVFIVIRQRSI